MGSSPIISSRNSRFPKIAKVVVSMNRVILSKAKDLAFAGRRQVPRLRFAEFTLSATERARNDKFMHEVT
jgi:hypothetical protein